jgi:uncharacterized protein with HEPN domain
VSTKDWRLRLQDILQAIAKVQAYTSNVSKEALFSNSLLIDAVARNFIIIGEAARYIPDEVQAARPQVPWADMRDMRNFLVHEYPKVDPQIVWHTICTDLPAVVPQLEDILKGEH